MKILFLGGGNMASALIGGLAGKLYPADQIGVIEIDPGSRERLQRQWPIRILEAPADPARQAEVVVLAVKPQQMRPAVQALKPFLSAPLVISIAAGIRGSDLAGWLGSDRIVRCMPNTPAMIGAGITGAAALPGASPEDRALAGRILQAVGEVVWVEREALLDPVTALSGSGPAYVFYFMEAMVAAGVEMGLDAGQARQLAQATFIGAARLAEQSTDSLAMLRERVTSKGGTTAAALASFEHDRIGAAIARGLAAANARAAELAEAYGNA